MAECRTCGNALRGWENRCGRCGGADKMRREKKADPFEQQAARRPVAINFSDVFDDEPEPTEARGSRPSVKLPPWAVQAAIAFLGVVGGLLVASNLAGSEVEAAPMPERVVEVKTQTTPRRPYPELPTRMDRRGVERFATCDWDL